MTTTELQQLYLATQKVLKSTQGISDKKSQESRRKARKWLKSIDARYSFVPDGLGGGTFVDNDAVVVNPAKAWEPNDEVYEAIQEMLDGDDFERSGELTERRHNWRAGGWTKRSAVNRFEAEKGKSPYDEWIDWEISTPERRIQKRSEDDWSKLFDEILNNKYKRSKR